ncbi:phosphotriesterase family protein [Sciscionella sediminilitoris]|uniref:phosphotriesterase family protein n=1 Tax=Sciscionella sediminilitoris TaxID=1445613 RepID=UPI0004DFAC21|nr:phosphotriesterase [Sciscionella sp. SE31]
MNEVRTVTGMVPASELGIVLPHEHLFNDLSGVLDAPSYPFSAPLAGEPVSAARAWALRHDPYCCADNLAAKPVGEVLGEVGAFAALGGRTIVDVTSSAAIGRNPARLVEVSRRSGVHVVMGCGAYLEKFEGARIGATAEEQATAISAELDEGVAGVLPGIIGEIGVSPDFTAAEAASLRAAGLAQLDHPRIPLMVHLPGWQRRGHEVLDLLIDQVGVAPDRIVLAHMDPSGQDRAYQRAIADRGVWLEFDMLGMDITFPHEGTAPGPLASAEAIAELVRAGHGERILLSHDLFLKQMWTGNGGNGFLFVPSVFAEMLAAQGIEHVERFLRENPARMLAG